MAVTLSREHPVRPSLGGGRVATEFVLPKGADYLSFRFIANDGKLAVSGADGVDIGAAYETWDADVRAQRAKPRPDSVAGVHGTVSVFLASATGSTVVETTARRRGL